MKYTSKNLPLYMKMSQSTWYKGTKVLSPKGVLWHSTGANNPTLKRYCQPDDKAADRQYWLDLLGVNKNGNDWNHITREAGVNAWIGKLADGSVTALQVGPWNYGAWGCSSGSKGSCNNGWIQFEICEDGLTDKTYFNKVYNEAVELTAYLCYLYDIDPLGSSKCGSATAPNILCHQDSYKLGLGSNHGDVYHWFNKYGKTMDNVRNDVKKIVDAYKKEIADSTPSIFRTGDLVAIKPGAKYFSGKDVPSWVIKERWYLTQVSGSRAVLGENESKSNNINSPIDVCYLDLVTASVTIQPSEELYRVRITWEDSKSQKGAYKNLDSAKALADDNAEAGYKVFNSLGQVVYTPAVKKPETPAVTVGETYVLVTAVNKYHTAADAKKKINATGTYQAGTYYIYNKYPNGSSNGMFNISTDKTGTSAGAWINPAENVQSSTDTTISDIQETVEMYRVRITWEDSKTQVGAYSSLDNAKKTADELAAQGYKVFDNKGNVVYTPRVKPSEHPTSTVEKPEETEPQPTPTTSTNEVYYSTKTYICGITDFPEIEIDECKSYYKILSNNPNFDKEICQSFFYVAPIYGIDPVMMIAQSILETGWFKFKGSSVSPSQHNYCGLGATGGGVAGAAFESIDEGVNAQAQHLYAYGCKDPLPAGIEIVDPRYSLVTRGKATTWEELAGKWACPGYDKSKYPTMQAAADDNQTYGQKILAIAEQLRSTEIAEAQINSYYEIIHIEVPEPELPDVSDDSALEEPVVSDDIVDVSVDSSIDDIDPEKVNFLAKLLKMIIDLIMYLIK